MSGAGRELTGAVARALLRVCMPAAGFTPVCSSSAGLNVLNQVGGWAELFNRIASCFLMTRQAPQSRTDKHKAD